MIWLRRAFTVPLGLVLLVSLLIVLVVLQFGDTFLDPGYYPKELEKASIYEFALVDLTTSALNEVGELGGESLPGGLEENPVITLDLPTEDIVLSVNVAIPPEWIQGLVEETFDEMGRYITGGQDEFEVTPRAGDQVVIIVEEIKSLLRKADAYNLLFEELVTPAIEDAVGEKLPFGLTITSDRLVASVRRTVSPEWVQEQVEATLDEVTPYVVGDRDTFEIKVDLSDLVETALEEIKGLLRDAEVYDLLYDEIIEPTLADRLGAAVELPFGIDVTREEIVAALRQVAPPEWVQEQAERVIDEAGPYITGETDDLSVSVSIADNKREARDVIVETVKSKFNRAVEALPECTAGETLSELISGFLFGLPNCIPAGVQPDAFVDQVADTVAEGVDSFVLGQIPDEILFTDTVLRETLTQAGAAENIDLLDDVRELVRDGWTYTDLDLRQDIREIFGDAGQGDEAIEVLDDVRAFLADDWTYTEIDLREDIAEAGGEDVLKYLDRGRTNFDRARRFRLLLYLSVLPTLVSIGFLGGRSWRGRFAWASATLAVASGVIFVASGPVYDALGESRLEDAKETAIRKISLTEDFKDTERLAIDKAFEMTNSVADGFASGVATKSLILLIVGTAGLGLSLGWRNIRALVRRRKPPE